MITVLTATYNRNESLKILYQSLKMQTDKRFKWLIIDDGSTDETSDYINSLNEYEFKITYIKKENGGKHTALNCSHDYIESDWTIMVDSDDQIIPEAISIINEECRRYNEDEKIAVISFLRADMDTNKSLSKENKKEKIISDEITFRVNRGIGGDRCEIVRTDIFKQIDMPIFPKEKYMPEGWLWRRIACMGYKTVYINKKIYLGKYLSDGLTKQGRMLRMNNPMGMMTDCRSHFIKEISLWVKVKEAILYWVYGIAAGYTRSEIIKTSGAPRSIMIITMLLGEFYYFKWNKCH